MLSLKARRNAVSLLPAFLLRAFSGPGWVKIADGERKAVLHKPVRKAGLDSQSRHGSYRSKFQFVTGRVIASRLLFGAFIFCFRVGRLGPDVLVLRDVAL
jgi:hypothetical protein